jgi:phosphate uptake regulator
METRKLQKTGGASLTLTLPKKWIDSQHLQDKDHVTLAQQQAGTLLIKASSENKPLHSTLLIDDMSQQKLTRELLGHFISGSDEIVVTGTQILPKHREWVRKVLQNMIGFEIVDESSTKITLKNVMDSTKFPIKDTVFRMFTITDAMLSDVFSAYKIHDANLALDVISRDAEIDKLHLVITRQFHSLIRDHIFEEDILLDHIALNYYENIGIQLERIADHAVKIAQAIVSHQGPSRSTNLASIMTSVKDLFTEAKIMVSTLDKAYAHKLLDTNEKVHKSVQQIQSTPSTSYLQTILIDSSDRIRGYIMNMAELTIDQAIASQR